MKVAEMNSRPEVVKQVASLVGKKIPDHRVRKWASRNAYTLIFLSVLFILTWTIQVVSVIWKG